MPSGDTTRRSRRVQVNETKASQTSAVVARPVDLHVAPRQKTDHLLEALTAIQPTLAKFSNKHIADEQKKTRQEAEAMRYGMSAEDANKFVSSPEFQERDEIFRRAFMLNHGKMDGRSYRDQITGGYDTDFNPEAESIDKFKERYQPQPRSQDADYLEGFNFYTNQGLEAVDNAEHDRQVAKAKEDVTNASYQDALEFIEDAASTNRTINATELQIFKENAEVLGITKKEAEVIMLSAVDSLAVEGKPELYDIFYAKRSDGSPGLAHTAEFGERIAKSKAAAERIRESNATKAEEKVKFDARVHLNSVAEKGMLTEHEASKYVDILGAATAMGYLEESNRRALEIAELEQVKNSIRTGNGIIYKDEKYFQQAMDEVSEEILKESEGNPSAISRVVDLGIQNGTMYTKWKRPLEGANPLNTAQFQQMAFLYQNIQAANPAYAAGLISEKQRIVLDTYNMAKAEGATEDQALELAQRIGTPEAKAQAELWLQGQQGREIMSDIDARLVEGADDASGWIWDDNIQNQPYVRNMMREKVRFRIQKGMNPDTAIESAFTDFQNTHIVVRGRYLFTGRNPIAQNGVAQLEEYLDGIPGRRADAGLDVDPEGYYLNSDDRTAIDGTYAVHDSVGFPTGTRINLQNLMKSKQHEEAARRKQEVIDEQSQYMKDQEGLKVYQETAP